MRKPWKEHVIVLKVYSDDNFNLTNCVALHFMYSMYEQSVISD